MGGTISVKYSVISQNKKQVLEHTYNIPVSKLVTVTETKNWSNTNKYTSYSGTDHNRLIGYAFGSKVYDENNPIYTKSSGNGGLDIIGSLDAGKSWGVTSYGCSGLQYFVKVGEDIYLARFDADKSNTVSGVTTNTAAAYYKLGKDDEAIGYTSTNTTLTLDDTINVGLTIKAEVQYDEETPYLKLTHSVTGGGPVSVGAVMDTLVADSFDAAKSADNDSVAVTETSSGFTMKGSTYKFEAFLKNSLGVDDVSNFWYGVYSNENGFNYFDTVFGSVAPSLTEGQDSTLSFRWDSVAPGESKVIRFTLSQAE